MKTVLTGGKFNAIHEGHLRLLKKARSLGDRLVVVLAHDTNNKRSYALPAEKRKKRLEETDLVDEVVIGDPEDYAKIVRKIKPSVIVLGYDQELPPGVVPGGIKVVRLGRHGDYSTNKMNDKKD
jgi:FAD synthetase